jgi:predicted acylesterase/phospholipase RssA
MCTLPTSRPALLAVALACALWAPAAGAQITFGDDTAAVRPLALSISGGISLGAYQAGVNFGLLELYRHAARDPAFRASTGIPRYRLRSVTGASAGNINTLLWAIEACTDPRPGDQSYRSPDPQESLFWQVWSAIGWNQLFKENSQELALFDRASLIEGLLKPLVARRMADPRLVDGCTVPAGITITRVDPDKLRFQNLDIQTQRVVTVFHAGVVGDPGGGDTRMRFTPVDRISREDQTFGVLVHLAPSGGEIPFDHLLSAIKASAAFPLAFAPVELDVWYPGSDEPTRSMFLDGGVFDNNPVGTARNLYGLSGETSALDILYVNPYRYRSELWERRPETFPGPTPGGLASVTRLVRGAVPTARQYELQLLTRERAQREQAVRDEAVRRQRADGLRPRASESEREPAPRPFEERLLLSSRAYPVFGEHLGAFAAFLARPAREFDFHVGVYDAFYLALWEHSCAAAPTDAERHACVGRRLPGLIEHSGLLREPARQVVTRLYNREYAELDGDRREERLRMPPVAPGMGDRMTVQRALFDAMGTQFEPVDPRSVCRDRRLIHSMLCADGLDVVLNTLRRDTAAARVIRGWAAACDSIHCDAEPVFHRLVADPGAGGTQLLDDVFDRVRRVERMMRRHTVEEEEDFLRLVTGLQFMFHASHLRSRDRLELIPSSVPRGSWPRYVPLSYVGANMGTSGVEARWQPTWSLAHPWLVRGAVIYHYNAQPIGSDDEHFAGLGGGVGRSFSWVVASEVGLEAHHFRSADALRDRDRSATELEAYGVLLAGQIRLAVRWLPNGDDLGRLHGRRGWAVAAGLSDPMGLGFWMTRIFQGG